jgi:SAM-dependent methyltransferase
MGPVPGLERALALLDGPPAPASGGYLDLLGERAPPAGRAQRLMLTTALPRVYERWWRPALGRLAKGPLGSGMGGERRLARRLLALEDGDTVLDIGCGTGAFTRDFAAVVGALGLAIGLDAAPAMLARAVRETLAGNVAYVRADAERLPFRPASFDAICCFAALHLLADPWAALDEIGRVLAPGGRLALLTSHRRRGGPILVIESGLGALLDVRMFAAGELDAALQERGLDTVHRQVQGLVQFVGARKA